MNCIKDNGKYISFALQTTRYEYNKNYPIGIVMFGRYPMYYNAIWEPKKKTLKEKIERPFTKYWVRVK